MIIEELEQFHPKTLAEHLGVRTDGVLVIAGGKAEIANKGSRAVLALHHCAMAYTPPVCMLTKNENEDRRHRHMKVDQRQFAGMFQLSCPGSLSYLTRNGKVLPSTSGMMRLLEL